MRSEMASRIPSGLARIPLWKREIPTYPLYYKGDPKRREFLPLFWMKMIPPEEKIPPNYVHFIVHPQMNKLDIKQYLEKIYKVPVLSIRTELRRKDIQANIIGKGQKITPARDTIWREEEKYAYVQLDKDEFEFPDFFGEEGKTEDMKNKIDMQETMKEGSKTLSTRTGSLGLPYWFTGNRNPTNQK